MSKTQTILKDKSITLDSNNQPATECSPCKAKQLEAERLAALQQQAAMQVPTEPVNETCVPCQQNQIWKVYIHNSSVTTNIQHNFTLVGTALEQFAKFTAPQVQSVLTSITLLPSEWNLIYSGKQDVAEQIYNQLTSQGIGPKIEAALKTF